MPTIKELLKQMFSQNKSKPDAVKQLAPLPSKKALDAQFDAFLENVSMPPQTITRLRNMSDQNKWLMICQSKQVSQIETPSNWAAVLKKPASVETLHKFRVVITSAEFGWMQSFVDEKGLFRLISKNLGSNQKNEEAEIACLRAVRAFMNSDFGLKVTIKSVEVFEYFITPLRSENEEVLMLVFDFFTVVSWVSVQGHEIVFDLLEHNRNESKSKTIFSPAIKAINNESHGIQVKISAMTFINAMINSIHDLEERNHNRSFLLDENILDVIQTQRTIISSKNDSAETVGLSNQFDLFEKEYENDQKESNLLNVNLSDPESVWSFLMNSSMEHGQSAYLVDLMRYLLIIPNIRRLANFIWLNCTNALKLGTMFVVNDKEVEEIEKNIQNLDDKADINQVIKKSFTASARLLKYEEIESIMKKSITANKEAIGTVDSEFNELQKEYLDYKTKAETEISELKKKIAAGVSAPGAPTESLPMASSAPLPPSLGGDAPLPPAIGGALLPPPLSGGPLPPPMALGGPAAPPMALGGPGVPPPLGMAAPASKEYLPKRPNPAPKIKMKNLHWGPLPVNKIEGTIWDEIKDDRIILNVNELEDTFKAKVSAPKKTQGDAKPKKVIKEKVTLVDSKRSTNVEIALSRFKMSPEVIRDAILAMDEKILNEDKIEKLLTLVPTAEEADVCGSFDGNLADLGVTEKFFRVVSAIPNIEERLHAFQFKLAFKTNYDAIMQEINHVKKCVLEIKNNKDLKNIFAIILKIGNHMNGGTKKGGVYGFKLSTLKQLNSTKSADNKITLMQYVVKYVTEKHPDAMNFTKSLNILDDAVRIDSQNLQAKVNKMKSSINKISGLVKKEPCSPRDRFKAIMENFYNDAAEKAACMHTEITSALKISGELIEKFCEDKGKIKWEEFFQIINDFVKSFESGKLFWKRRKEMEEKEKKKQKFAQESKNRKNKMVNQKKQEENGAGDNVLNNLKNAPSDKLAEEILKRRRFK